MICGSRIGNNQSANDRRLCRVRIVLAAGILKRAEISSGDFSEVSYHARRHGIIGRKRERGVSGPRPAVPLLLDELARWVWDGSHDRADERGGDGPAPWSFELSGLLCACA
jgi:hypothetical protein